MNLFSGQYIPIPVEGAFQAIEVDDQTAVRLTLPANVHVKYAFVQVLGAPVNWRDDGIDPVSAINGGMFMKNSWEPTGLVGNLDTIRFISISSGGSTLLVSYYK